MTLPYPFNIINEFRAGKLDKSSTIDKLFLFLLKTDDHKSKIIVVDFLLTLYRDLRGSILEPKYVELFKEVIQIGMGFM